MPQKPNYKIITNERTGFFVFCFALCLSLFIEIAAVRTASAKAIVVAGAVYPVVEKDAIKEMEDKASKVDLSKYEAELKNKIKSYKPKNLVALKKAAADRIFTVDITYTLDFDIPDGKGGILYPKGFTFNPLDYTPFNKTIVVINGADEDEIRWFIESEYYAKQKTNIYLLVTDGEWMSLSQRLKMPVFYLTTPIAYRLRLVSTPCIVKRSGNNMEVREFDVKRSIYKNNN